MPLIFLTKEEILTRITEVDLNVIISGDETLLDEPEADAIFEVSSYLAGRYDTDKIFYNPDDPAAPKNATIKRIVIDVALYNLHTRVNPRNIPEKRIQLRDDGISWLKLVQDVRSNVTADFLPLRDFGEDRGNDISWGSRKKNKHNY